MTTFDRNSREIRGRRGCITARFVAAFVIVATAATGWSVYRSQHQAAALTISCAASSLNLSIGPSQGTAGTIYTDAVFTNQSNQICVLKGYPKVTLVNSHNTVLGSAAAHNTAFPALAVTLAPGASAHAAIGFPDPGNFDPGVCSAASTNLMATPPALSTHLETPLVRQYCPGFSVTAILPGL